MIEEVSSLQAFELLLQAWATAPWWLNAILAFIVLNPVAIILSGKAKEGSNLSVFWKVWNGFIVYVAKPIALDWKKKNERDAKAAESANDTDKKNPEDKKAK